MHKRTLDQAELEI
jgi:hypothetical protein